MNAQFDFYSRHGAFNRYGLGTVYLKENKLRKAGYHFGKAIEISPSNAVLVSCEGTVSRIVP